MTRLAVKPVPQSGKRPITSVEVMQWFGRKPPGEAACAEIAERLTKMRWAKNPPLPAIGNDKWWVRGVPNSDNPNPPWRSKRYKADPWWDTQKAAAAVRVLLDEIPAMRRHWQKTQRTRAETRPGYKPARRRGGYDAIKRLRIALNAALPYIEFPVGEYERRDHRKKPRPSDWHMPALVIKSIVSQGLMKCGQKVPGFSRDAPATSVVHRALSRMGYKVSRRIGEGSETNTIAAFLNDWKKRWDEMGKVQTELAKALEKKKVT